MPLCKVYLISCMYPSSWSASFVIPRRTTSLGSAEMLFKQQRHLATSSPFGSVTLNLYMSIWMMMIIVIHYAIRSLKVGEGGALYSFQKIIPTQQLLLLQWKEIKQNLKICRMSCRTIGALLYYRLTLRLMNSWNGFVPKLKSKLFMGLVTLANFLLPSLHKVLKSAKMSHF